MAARPLLRHGTWAAGGTAGDSTTPRLPGGSLKPLGGPECHRGGATRPWSHAATGTARPRTETSRVLSCGSAPRMQPAGMWGTRRVPDFGFPKSFLALFMLVLGKGSVTLGTAVGVRGEASYSRDTAGLSTGSQKSTKAESDWSARLRTGVPKALRPSTHLAPDKNTDKSTP